MLISQMHVAMIRAHNRLVGRLRADGVPDAGLFDQARRALTWHYQYVVLHDYLPETIGQQRAARLLERGPRRFRPEGTVAIPLEFADAAYRFGHSQMRDSYQLQPGGPALKLMPDLIGFRPTPPAAWCTGRCCSTSPASHRPSARGRSTAACPTR